MELNEDVTPRELDIKLQALRERVDMGFHARDEALNLQYAETQRRLFELNGEAGRLRAIQETYWPRENAEAYIKEAAAREEKVLARVEETRLALEKATGETTLRLEQQIQELRSERKTDTNISTERNISLVALAISVVALLVILL